MKVEPQQEMEIASQKPLPTPTPSFADSEDKRVEQTSEPIKANKHEIKENGQKDMNDALQGALNGLDPLELVKIIQDLSRKLKEKDKAAAKPPPQPIQKVVAPIQPEESPSLPAASAPVHAEDKHGSSLALALPTKGPN